jgi:hypothetical protein
VKVRTHPVPVAVKLVSSAKKEAPNQSAGNQQLLVRFLISSSSYLHDYLSPRNASLSRIPSLKFASCHGANRPGASTAAGGCLDRRSGGLHGGEEGPRDGAAQRDRSPRVPLRGGVQRRRSGEGAPRRRRWRLGHGQKQRRGDCLFLGC